MHTSWAQQPFFKNYTVDYGLPSSEVYKMLQDSKGYMWFATDYGLCRYDGNQFKYYSTQDGLSDNTIFLMHEDYRGRIWLCTFSGKISYLENGQIFNLSCNDSIATKMNAARITSIYVDKGDTIWLGLRDKEAFYKIAPGRKYGYGSEGKTGDIILKLLEDKYFLWSKNTTREKNKILEIQVGRQRRYIQISLDALHYANHYFLKWDDGTYAIAADKELILINKSGEIVTKKFEHFILAMYKDGDGFWLGFRNGGTLRIRDKKVLSIQEGPYLQEKSISGILKDKENGYWFSTLESGVYYTPSFDFLIYTNTNSILSDNRVTGFAEGPNEEIVLSLFNNDLFYLKEGGLVPLKVKEPNPQQILKAIYIDKSGNLWAAWSWYGTLFLPKVAEELNRNRYKFIPTGYTHNVIYEDSKGDIWLGFTNGISRITKQVFGPNDLFENKDKNINKLRVEAIAEQNDTLYLGTLNGVYGFIDNHFISLADKYPAFKNRVTEIKKDAKGRMWFATKGSGVLIKDGGCITSIQKKDGLISDFCNSVYSAEKNGQIWVCTNRGLSTIEYKTPVNYTVHNFTKTNGLVSDQIMAMCRQQDVLWLATSVGLVRWSVKSLESNKVSPPIYITSIFINEKLRIAAASHKLKSNEQMIEFKFEGISFKNAGRIQYKYMLEGLDQQWTYSYSTSVKYSKLPYGKYTFKVQAENNDGLWSIIPATFEFYIPPAFYQTGWFLLIAVLGFGAFIWLAIYMYYKRVRRKEMLNQRIIESEQKALRAQMNPHFIFNALNSIQQFIVKSDIISSSSYLSVFSNLMRSILENSRNTYISLAEEINSLQLYMELEALRFENKLTYTFQVDEKVDINSTQVPTMLIQPHLENAIKHGLAGKSGGGKIDIIIRKTSLGILCCIQDNGIGRIKSAENKKKNHTSLGQTITQERIDIFNFGKKNKITLDVLDLQSGSGGPLGTQVNIFIPTG